jgi:hypothetical protein
MEVVLVASRHRVVYTRCDKLSSWYVYISSGPLYDRLNCVCLDIN